VLDRAKGLAGPAVLVFSCSAIFGARASIDDFLVLFLRQDSGEAVLAAFARNFDFASAFLTAIGSALGGLTLALAVAAAVGRVAGRGLGEIFAAVSSPFVTLLVPAGLSALAVVSLILSPTYPYGLGLALTLALEGSFATFLTWGLFGIALVRGLASFEASPERFAFAERLLAPGILAAALVVFTLATPSEFYADGAGQGNMFKYLRMAAALAGTGTLDIGRAEENKAPGLTDFLSRLPDAAHRYVAETRKLLGAVIASAAEGRLYVGELTARRANRSMFRSADGGIYYINAPGPGFLLVPAYLVDRFLNRTLGTERQVAAIVFWQILGALLVHQMALAASAIGGGRAAALALAFAFALAVPILFYTFQIYPELPAALLLLFAFRKLVLDPFPSALGTLAAGFAIGALPWLHQKYSVVAAALALYGAHRFIHRKRPGWMVEAGSIALLSAPLAVSAFSIFLYNHALTGSLSPAATFSAAERSSFEPGGFVKGFLGLFLDRENGLFVFAPIYLLALIGFPALRSKHEALVRPLLLVVLSYLVVIASFPYWPGAVSTMGRYVLSILPLLVLPSVVMVKRAFADGILAGSGATLAAASFAMSWSFVRDLVPSYQPRLLWDRVLYSDPVQLLPDFQTGGLLGSGPAHFPKLLAALLFVALLIHFLSGRKSPEGDEPSPRRFARHTAISAGLLILAAVGFAALLERFPGNETRAEKPVFRETRDLGAGRELSVHGRHGFEGEGVWVPGGGRTRFVLLTHSPLTELYLSFSNGPAENEVEILERDRYRTALDLPAGGPHDRAILLRKPYRFLGPRGERFIYEFSVHSRGSFVPKEEGRADDRRRLGTYVRVR
jgi:hypothetical protein